MPTARTIAQALGKQFILQVNKTDAVTPVWVTVGCAKSVNYKMSKEVLTTNCYAGKTKQTSGDDADYDVSVSGFYTIYATADVAANISATEIEGYAASGALKSWRIAPPFTGDPIRTFNAVVSSFDMTGEVSGQEEYSFTLNISGVPVLSTQV